jgi:hypothetical protein
MRTVARHLATTFVVLLALVLSVFCPGLPGLCAHGYSVPTVAAPGNRLRRIMSRVATILGSGLPVLASVPGRFLPLGRTLLGSPESVRVVLLRI